MIYIKLPFIVVMFALLTAVSSEKLLAQKTTFQPSILEIKGYVNHGEEEVENAIVLLFQNNKVVKKITTKKNGKFQFLLFRDLKYVIEVLKDGFIDERIDVSTKESTDFSNKKYLYEFSIDLMKTDEFSGLGLTSFDFPSAKIIYSIEDDEYTYDSYYHKKNKLRIKKLKEMSNSIDNK
jgi:hypothetical protein